MEHDELLDVVDADDRVIGTVWRSGYGDFAKEKRGNIRVVELFIQNDKGQIWIPKRTATKKIAPNGLDYSMGGHVESGQSYEEAALREIKEELNLNLTAADLVVIKKFEPNNLPLFRTLYLYKTNDAPAYNPDDFVSAEWISPSDLIEKLDAGVPSKDNMHEAVASLLAHAE